MTAQTSPQLRIDAALGKLQDLAARKAGKAPAARAKKGYGYAPAAGTRQGAKPRQVHLTFPAKTVLTAAEMDGLYSFLSDWTTAGLYLLLRGLADFETGEVLGADDYAGLMATGMPPRPQQGPRRAGPSYEQVRRMLRELEAAGLVTRDTANNAAQGQLRLVLPHVSAAAEAYRKKLLAQRKSQQELAQARAAAKAASSKGSRASKG